MTCRCHPSDDDFSGVTAYTQCPRCARKHVVQAWTAWQELSHCADNRDYCAGNLRLAGEHLASLAPRLAESCRDAAIMVEDGESRDDVLARLNYLRESLANLASDPIPLIIPYRIDESYEGRGDELRILLRSVERHVSGLSEVRVVCDRLPGWLDESKVRWIRQGDPYAHCKDANLFLKMCRALDGETGVRWCFSADDAAFLKPCDLRTLPVIYNGHAREWFAANPSSKWHRRMVNTFDYLASQGIQMAYSYDCHVPQTFEVSTVTERLDGVPYDQGDGYCIYTLWRGLEGRTSGDVLQSTMVSRFGDASEGQAVPLDKPLCTYSNAPFGAGLRERLFALFPTPSKYEK